MAALVLLAGCLAGTPAGPPYVVKDILPGLEGSSPVQLVDVNGTLFFVAFDPVHGRELWVSDGTEAGTLLVQDIRPGPESGLVNTREILDLAGTALFAATEPQYGEQWWRSDGTAGGTRLIKEIHPGNGLVSGGVGARSVGALMYFPADDGEYGNEPWRTDGSAEGTFLLRDLYPGLSRSNPRLNGGSYPDDFVRHEPSGLVYFTADDGFGRDLWKTDGTPGGTMKVTKLPPGLNSLEAAVGDTLFFWLEEPAAGRELWASDGTSGSMRLVKDILPGPDGSNPSYVAPFAHGVLFAATDGVHGIELWRSDGTPEGTLMVRDLRSGAASSVPRSFTRVGPITYFTASEEGTCSLWMTDGTEKGTQIVPDGEGLCPVDLTLSGSRLFFTVSVQDLGFELWALDIN